MRILGGSAAVSRSCRRLAWTGLLLAFGCGGGGANDVGAPGTDTAFVVHDPAPAFQAPHIVLYHDALAGIGFDWDTARARMTNGNTKVFGRDAEALAWGAAAYLEEGIRKMTGRSLVVESGTEIEDGIVLLPLEAAPPALRDDPAVRAALGDSGEDAYDFVESYYIRTSARRALILAHGPAGWINGVVALLESVDYEVLGMGPDWIHLPDRHDGLVFDLATSGRPSWYLRELTATSGQYYGVGTIYDTTRTPLVDSSDEPVDDSYWRWRVGTRTWGMSMPPFPGHALQALHGAVLDAMRAGPSSEGFLASTTPGLAAARPAADVAGAGHLWVNTDAEGTPGYEQVLVSNGTVWTAYDPAYLPVSLDLSVPLVRQVVLQDLETRSETWFAAHPDELYLYATDPEDGGGYADFAARVAYPNWYADYRVASGDPLGAPYPLDGRFGLAQPVEAYDPTSVADCVYAFNDWLLREYDAWLGGRPPAERATATGKAKRDLVRMSFYSYNYHDVPPGFVPDPRMRVMIAGYPKNRGRGRWAQLATTSDVAAALHVLLPAEPPAAYSIWSLAYYQDFGVGGVVPTRSSEADAIQPGFADLHATGLRGFACEIDFNFGKHGLSYYLLPKVLWDAELDVPDLDALRDRWLRRAFGSGWEPMKAYFDLLTPEGWFANTETLWARAVQLLVEADAAIDPVLEPMAQRRLDDVKQTWWWHYLTVEGRTQSSDPDVEAFLWKGQMAYQVAMHVITRRVFGSTFLHDALDPLAFSEPAHYTPEETAAWWSTVQAAWEVTPVTLFADGVLADGTPAAASDLQDLVWTDELVAAGARIGIPGDRTFWFNSGYQKTATILIQVPQGGPVGFSMAWTEAIAREPSVGVERWDPVARAWEELVDPEHTTVTPALQHIAFPDTPGYVATWSMSAPVTGTYRVAIGRGGNVTQVTGSGFDFDAYAYDELRPCTYFQSQDGITQYAVAPHAFVYLPRGVSTLDLELLDDSGGTVKFFTRGVLTGEAYTTREVSLGLRGTAVIPLQTGEDGGIAAFTLVGFQFPVLYSVPQLWARSPAALLVPRAIALADGLAPR